MLDERGEIREKLCESKVTLKMRASREKEVFRERCHTSVLFMQNHLLPTTTSYY